MILVAGAVLTLACRAFEGHPGAEETAKATGDYSIHLLDGC
jgi:hypothetical protein